MRVTSTSPSTACRHRFARAVGHPVGIGDPLGTPLSLYPQVEVVLHQPLHQLPAVDGQPVLQLTLAAGSATSRPERQRAIEALLDPVALIGSGLAYGGSDGIGTGSIGRPGGVS